MTFDQFAKAKERRSGWRNGLSQAEYNEFMNEFAKKSGAIIKKVSWDDEQGIAEIMEVINNQE